MKKTADVVIIGGGIQGISLAYHLAKRGMTDVCLVEMNTLGSGSSGKSAALAGHALQTENLLPLSQWSYAAFMRFQEELGFSPDYVPIGSLLLAGPDSAPDLRLRHARLQRCDIESHLVDRDAIPELTPGLNLEDIEVGLYSPREGCIDPHSIMMAYAHHARRLGAAFFEDVRATGLQIQGDRVLGIHTTAGDVSAAWVVNAAGFRARQVAAWAGMDLPITNLKRHLFFTGPVPAYAGSIPFTYDMDASWYMRREGPGLLIGMGTEESDEEDPEVDWSFLDEVVDHSLHRAPPLAHARVRSGWAGLRPVTPDDDPILGPAPHLRGFCNDCGWGGHGIMNAPAAGQALAEWIMEGRAVSVNLGRFDAKRLAKRKVMWYNGAAPGSSLPDSDCSERS